MAAPVKINPWSRLAKAIGKAINADLKLSIFAGQYMQRDSQQRAGADKERV